MQQIYQLPSSPLGISLATGLGAATDVVPLPDFFSSFKYLRIKNAMAIPSKTAVATKNIPRGDNTGSSHSSSDVLALTGGCRKMMTKTNLC